jgi:hypothetical protein
MNGWKVGISRLRTAVALAAGLLAAPPAHAAAVDGWPKAAEWQGRYLFDKVGGVAFLDQPAVRKAAIALVGEQRYRQVLKAWTVSMPIQADGGSLLAQGCKPHDCLNNFVILIDGGRMAVCIHDSAKNTLAWFHTAGAKPSVRPGNGEDCLVDSVAQARLNLSKAGNGTRSP